MDYFDECKLNETIYQLEKTLHQQKDLEQSNLKVEVSFKDKFDENKDRYSQEIKELDARLK